MTTEVQVVNASALTRLGLSAVGLKRGTSASVAASCVGGILLAVAMVGLSHRVGVAGAVTQVPCVIILARVHAAVAAVVTVSSKRAEIELRAFSSIITNPVSGPVASVVTPLHEIFFHRAGTAAMLVGAVFGAKSMVLLANSVASAVSITANPRSVILAFAARQAARSRSVVFNGVVDFAVLVVLFSQSIRVTPAPSRRPLAVVAKTFEISGRRRRFFRSCRLFRGVRLRYGRRGGRRGGRIGAREYHWKLALADLLDANRNII